MATDIFPEHGEIVIGRITKILDYGVFMELLEYEGLHGFVHISNVSSSWVKNIRNFVKEGQIRAAKIVNIDHRKKQLDLSLTKVSPNAQRVKIEAYKQAKRAQKLVELLSQKVGEKPVVAWSEVAEPLLEKYDSLYDAFQEILVKGEPVVSDLPEKWVKPLLELVEENFEVPVKSVRGRVFVSVPGATGVEVLKKALFAGQKKGGKSVEVFYEGSGNYALKATSSDYKSAEKILKGVSDEIISVAGSAGGKAEVVEE